MCLLLTCVFFCTVTLVVVLIYILHFFCMMFVQTEHENKHHDWMPFLFHSVLWQYWLGYRKLSDEVLARLSVWSEVQMICIWSSWCHFHSINSCFIKIQNGLPFSCWFTFLVVLEKRPLNGDLKFAKNKTLKTGDAARYKITDICQLQWIPNQITSQQYTVSFNNL